MPFFVPSPDLSSLVRDDPTEESTSPPPVEDPEGRTPPPPAGEDRPSSDPFCCLLPVMLARISLPMAAILDPPWEPPPALESIDVRGEVLPKAFTTPSLPPKCMLPLTNLPMAAMDACLSCGLGLTAFAGILNLQSQILKWKMNCREYAETKQSVRKYARRKISGGSRSHRCGRQARTRYLLQISHHHKH
jgi:hypothetical protein